MDTLKGMVTARAVMVNDRGRDQVVIDTCAHVVTAGRKTLLTNKWKDECVLMASSSVFSTALWRSWPLEQLLEEAPGFLHYLSTRTLKTEMKGRLWFHPDLLELAAHSANL